MTGSCWNPDYDRCGLGKYGADSPLGLKFNKQA